MTVDAAVFVLSFWSVMIG